MRMSVLAPVVALAAAAPAMLAAAPAVAQAPSAAFDSRAAVEAVRKALREQYVVKERRAALDAALARGLASGRYALADPRAFADRVTADMAEVAHDKHLSLRHDPRLASEIPAGGQRDDVSETAFWNELARRQNHGMRELKVFEGNVRYAR